MSDASRITLYHAPNTRSSAVLTLLAELDAPFELALLDMKAGEQRQPAYLAINPMGKVPAVVDRGQLVTELPAVFIHLADRFAQAGLAPALDDPLRGPYLRWLVFYGSCFEPALIDRAMNRDAGPQARSPYGSFDDVMTTLNGQLARGPYLLGERYSAADVLWGTALAWSTGFQLVRATPEIAAYLERVTSRPAFARAKQQDADLAAELERRAQCSPAGDEA